MQPSAIPPAGTTIQEAVYHVNDDDDNIIATYLSIQWSQSR